MLRIWTSTYKSPFALCGKSRSAAAFPVGGSLAVIVLLIAFSGTCASADGAPQSDDRPNILWIVIEDASTHIGCYGETTIQTPHLDALAAAGVRFT